MKQSIKNISAALLSTALLATSAFAFPNPDRSNIEAENWLAPAPIDIVAPEIGERHEGMVVKVRLTVDVNGQPQDVRVVTPHDRMLAKQVVKAVKQWSFTPAIRDGVAVETRVVMPIELKLDQKS